MKLFYKENIHNLTLKSEKYYINFYKFVDFIFQSI